MISDVQGTSAHWAVERKAVKVHTATHPPVQQDGRRNHLSDLLCYNQLMWESLPSPGAGSWGCVTVQWRGVWYGRAVDASWMSFPRAFFVSRR